MSIETFKQKLIHPKCILSFFEDSSTKQQIIQVKEEENKQFKKGEKLEKVIIKGLPPENSLVFTLDNSDLGRLSNYLNHGTPNITKACDVVILTQIEEQGYIFICDLKSKRKSGLAAKLLNSEIFLQYINLLANYFENTNINTFQKAFVVFCKQTNDNIARPPRKPTLKNKQYPKSSIEILEVETGLSKLQIHVNQLIEKANFVNFNLMLPAN